MARINPGMMMLDGGESRQRLVAVAVQAAVASPAVVNTPANVAPKAAEVEKVVTDAIKTVAPDNDRTTTTELAKQITQAVITNPAVIAAPAGQTVNTTTVQGIIAASAQPVPGTGGVMGGSSNAGAYASSGFPGSDKTPAATFVAKPDPTKIAYADLTPAQRAAMSQQEKMDYIEAARVASMASAASTRAASNPMFDFANRPTAPTPKPGMINYYSWIGGVKDGEWKLYEAADTPENQAKYGARSVGGATAATANSAVGANTLVTPVASGTGVPTKVVPTGKKEVSKKDNGDGTFTITYDDGSTEITGTKTVSTTDRPIGTPPAFVYDPISKTWKMPEKPAGEGNWTWDNLEGWVNTNVTPGSTGMEAGSERTIAKDTFKNTLALYFGANEMSQPWADALFKVVSGYYKSGSDIQESLNLALQEVRNNPVLKPFTDRFAGVYALQDRRAKGEALDVPTIAEFFTSQVQLGDRLREVGLGDIATNEILGEVLGTGKSVASVLSLVNDVFMTIDNAPEALKKDLQAVAPGIDRTSIAKALLLGQKGAEALQKQIKEVSVLSAAKTQGINIENTLASDIAARGVDYGTALTNFGTIAKVAPDLQKLTEISTGKAVKPTDAQGTLIKSLFQQDVKAQEQIRLEAEKEIARFGGSSGTFGSRSLASRNRANRVI